MVWGFPVYLLQFYKRILKWKVKAYNVTSVFYKACNPSTSPPWRIPHTSKLCTIYVIWTVLQLGTERRFNITDLASSNYFEFFTGSGHMVWSHAFSFCPHCGSNPQKSQRNKNVFRLNVCLRIRDEVRYESGWILYYGRAHAHL